jgi:ATP-dependent helicase/nuclease subunit A
VLQPTFALAAAKAISVTPTKLPPSSGEHGTEWGSVVHSLLEIAMRHPAADLRRLAEALLLEQSLDPALADQAVETVRAVSASEIWRRAQSSSIRLAEVPFQILQEVEPGVASALPTILRGVIDLVFREREGWVVVDYKTDARPPHEMAALVEHYRGQVQTYARIWERVTGERVIEAGLYFTHRGEYIRL